MKRTRLLRMLCAFAFILLVFFGLILHTGSGTLSAIGWRDIAAVCPLGALEAMLAEKTLIPRAILGALAVVAFCLILGRVPGALRIQHHGKVPNIGKACLKNIPVRVQLAPQNE